MDRDRVKKLWRAARDMHQRLVRQDQFAAQLTLPRDQWRRCRRQLVRIARLHNRGWQSSLALIEPEVAHDLRAMKVQLDALAASVAKLAKPRPIVLLTDLFRDLVALEEEFGGLEICFEESTFTVVTEAIELADQYLGPFAIELKWSTFDQPGRAYQVHALEPIDEETPHPHVRSGVLCEGEAAYSIAQALEQGRIYDLFVIVRQVLRNYNPESAYDGFDDSSRVACIDCGYRASEEERIWCQGCDNDVCDECSRLCESCSQVRCHGCVETCTECDEYVCAACQKKCAHCDELYCKRCVTDDRTCKNCREEEWEAASAAESIPPAGAEPAVLAVCLGQAAVPA
ncbi:MAG: hypothetical protein WD851_09000 [Pirellulales bacterium]